MLKIAVIAESSKKGIRKTAKRTAKQRLACLEVFSALPAAIARAALMRKLAGARPLGHAPQDVIRSNDDERALRRFREARNRGKAYGSLRPDQRDDSGLIQNQISLAPDLITKAALTCHQSRHQ